jgi:hypothetical protein
MISNYFSIRTAERLLSSEDEVMKCSKNEVCFTNWPDRNVETIVTFGNEILKLFTGILVAFEHRVEWLDG